MHAGLHVRLHARMNARKKECLSWWCGCLTLACPPPARPLTLQSIKESAGPRSAQRPGVMATLNLFLETSDGELPPVRPKVRTRLFAFGAGVCA